MEKFLDVLANLPLLGPFLALLRSRKFLVAVGTIAVNALIAQFPQLAPVQESLMALVTALAGVVIASIAYEDASLNRSNGAG